MTEKRDFEATEGLLHDVMRKQAGSVEKAILEAVMNSVDAGATEISVSIEHERMTIHDDGAGMSSDDIESYFQKFGLKDDDITEKEFGKFRMGRGQIFNFGLNIWLTNDHALVVNLNEDETHINSHDIDATLDTKGLSYNLIERDKSIDGCLVDVQFYNKLDSVSDTVTEVQKLVEFIQWLHDVDISINGDWVQNETVFDVETENAYFVFEPEEDIASVKTYLTDTAVYNKGAFVKTVSKAPVQSVIVSKQGLDVNFARNDIIEGDEYWQQISSEFDDACCQYLIDKRDLNDKESRWLLKQADGDDALLHQITDIPLVADINNNKHSISELGGEDIAYTHTGDAAADDIMQQSGVLFIKEDYEGLLNAIVENSQFLSYDEVLESNSTFEMSHVKDDELSKRRRERLAQARWFVTQLGFTQDVEAGYSQNANVWMDDDLTLYIHKGLLKSKKMEFLTKGLDEILEVIAHDADTRQGRNHGHSFRRNYWEYSKHRAEAQRKLLQGNADYDEY